MDGINKMKCLPLRLPRFLVILLTAGLLASSQLTLAAPRSALVIGNAAYAEQSPLMNTLNDARDIAQKLRENGFKVSLHLDLNRKDLARAVNTFIRDVSGSSGVALLYYSGHGIQVDGVNYLVPVDAELQDALDVPNEAVSLDQILAGMDGRGDEALNLVILDACRNNPYQRGGARSISGKGLAKAAVPSSGTLILYATRPGETASDNPEGRNGLFTKHLLAAMDKPQIQIEDAFKLVAKQVYLESERVQSPWMEGVLFGQFYLHANVQPAPAASSAASVSTPRLFPSPVTTSQASPPQEDSQLSSVVGEVFANLKKPRPTEAQGDTQNPVPLTETIKKVFKGTAP